MLWGFHLFSTMYKPSLLGSPARTAICDGLELLPLHLMSFGSLNASTFGSGSPGADRNPAAKTAIVANTDRTMAAEIMRRRTVLNKPVIVCLLKSDYCRAVVWSLLFPRRRRYVAQWDHLAEAVRWNT